MTGMNKEMNTIIMIIGEFSRSSNYAKFSILFTGDDIQQFLAEFKKLCLEDRLGLVVTALDPVVGEVLYHRSSMMNRDFVDDVIKTFESLI